MIKSQPWDLQNMDLPKCDSTISDLQFVRDWIIIKSDEIYDRNNKTLSSNSEISLTDSNTTKEPQGKLKLRKKCNLLGQCTICLKG